MTEMEQQTASGTTVCCLLCRGWIKDGYKEGNIDRFKSHMENEHALVFNLEYMLASSLMDQKMVEDVASSVKVVKSESSLLEEQQENTKEETLGETSGGVDGETKGDEHIIRGSKKDNGGKTIQCPHCPKMFSSKPGLKVHVEKKHVDNSTAEIGSLINEESKTIDNTEQEELNGTSFYEEDSFNSTLGENNLENMESAPDTEEATPETVNNPRDTEETEGSEDFPTSEANVKSYICVLCGKTSSTRQNFKIHLNRKHQEHAITDEFLDSCKSSDTVPSKPFPCSYPSCQKSYSSKVSLRTHEVKDHGAAKMAGGRRRKSMDDVDSLGATLANSDASVMPMDDLDDLLEEGRRRAEELARIKAEYYGDAHGEVSPAQIDSTANRDVNVDFKEPSQKKIKKDQPTDETEEKLVEESPISNIDTSLSKYFEKNPNVFANARGKSLKLFSEEAAGLPGGWKMRSIEREGKEGAKSTSIKHYLTPDQKVLKTGLAVIEYLRLEGKLNPDQLVEVRKVLKISDKKLRDLNDD